MEGTVTAEMPEKNDLADRVEKLQCQMRCIKLVSVTVSVLLACLIAIPRIHSRNRMSAAQVVTQDIVLTDSLGRVRARLTVFPDGSGLEINSASGERRVRLIGSGEESSLNFYLPVTAESETASVNFFHDDALMSSFRSGPTAAWLEMHIAHHQGGVILALQNTAASFVLSGAGENVPKVSLEADESHACAALGGIAQPSVGGSLCLHSPGLPSLELSDVAGNHTVLGIPQNPDLGTEESSAATLILKHKNGKKLLVAPR